MSEAEKSSVPILEFINDPEIYGRMNHPTSSARLKGPCGDEMEFYLVILDGQIKEIKYFSEGCAATRACGAMTARLALNKSVSEALYISPGDVMSRLKGLPDDHLHCSILAVSTFYRAIADYLLKS